MFGIGSGVSRHKSISDIKNQTTFKLRVHTYTLLQDGDVSDIGNNGFVHRRACINEGVIGDAN